MRLALRELRRRPGRFAVAGGALAFLTVLLLFLGGLLDGLYLGSTGLIRSQQAELLTFSDDARLSLLRSRIDPDVRAEVETVDGVETASGLGVALVAASVSGQDELVDASLVGYEGGAEGVPDPPAADFVGYADRRLEAFGVEEGDRLGVGPDGTEVEVVGWVEDTSFLLQGGLWVNPATWREVLGSARPDAVLPDGTFQGLAVAIEPGADPAAVAAGIDEATGSTETVTREEAVLALPGVKEQSSTLTAIINTTFLVVGIVVALFFALVTLERSALYAVLKAIGASSRQLLAGVVMQAVVVAGAALALGGALAYLLSLVVPPGVPVQFEAGRALQVVAGVLIASVLGSAVSLRRVIKVDPADAIS
jgi:putative ABC transport system permease protein